MPTITGGPAATWAAIHAALGPCLTTVACPGTVSAELYIAPRPSNHAPCEAMVAGVTDPIPKCEYTIARSLSRHPICQIGKVTGPTLCAAHRASRWLK